MRRTHHVLPQNRSRRDVPEENEEIITTARPSDPSRQDNMDQDTPQSTTQPRSPDEGPPPSGGMVRQWMSELAGAARPTTTNGTTVRVPSDSEIRMLTGMFPDIGRDAILGVLQRRCVITSFTTTVILSLSIVDP